MKEPMLKNTCADCGKVYNSFGQSRFCPICRKRRISDAAKARNLSKLGADAYSAKAKLRRERKEAADG